MLLNRKATVEKYTDDIARAKEETFIAAGDHRGQPEFAPVVASPAWLRKST